MVVRLEDPLQEFTSAVETALLLSVLRQEPFVVPRKRRLTPTQRALIDLAGTTNSADREQNHGEWFFEPTDVPGSGEYRFDLTSYNDRDRSASLMPAVRLFVVLLARNAEQSVVRFHGGTHVSSASPFQYFHTVFGPVLRDLGYHVESQLKDWGFPPKGDGRVTLTVNGKDRQDGSDRQWLSRGKLRSIEGVSVVGNLSSDILRRQTRTANNRLEEAGYGPVVESEPVESRSPGTVIHLTAVYEFIRAGFYAYGHPDKRAETVAREAVEDFLKYEDGTDPVDPFLAKRLVVPLLLENRPSEYRTTRVTPGLRETVRVAQKFSDQSLRLYDEDGTSGTVRIEGSVASDPS